MTMHPKRAALHEKYPWAPQVPYPELPPLWPERVVLWLTARLRRINGKDGP